MKLTHLPQLFILSAMILLCATACDDNDERLSTLKEVVMEGDANSIEIPMTRANWMITSIYYLDGWIEMRDEYNRPLRLEGLGSLHFDFGDIIRDKKDAFTLYLDDNLEWGERGMIINLATPKGIYTEQLVIRQKVCEGYQFKNITYSIEEWEGDGEKEAQPREYRLTFKNQSSYETSTIFPYFNMPEYYQFTSENPTSFSLLKEEPWVEVPSSIANNEIQMNGKKYLYAPTMLRHDCDLKEESFEVDTPSGKQTTVIANVRYKQSQVSYTLTLYNPRNQNEKQIKGKLLQAYPTSCTIRTEVNELPD